MNRYHHWENLHNGRYYVAQVRQDLLGDWIVRVCWGKKNTKLGRLKYIFCETEEKAIQYLKKLVHVRARRGYIEIGKGNLSPEK